MESPEAGLLHQAADRFVAFFRELTSTFVERDDLLQQVAPALPSRQHVLMTGPPGTAKSQLAHAVLGILGAVHAFLDEVFDGRDMLLRRSGA